VPPVDLELLILIGCGGAIGALARWGIAELVPTGAGLFPWATYVINVVGSFALGLLVGLAERVWPRTRVPRLFLGVGVLGGFTTFSTAMVESVLLVDAGGGGLALAYLAGSLIASVAAAVIGMIAAGTLIARGFARRTRSARPTDHDGVGQP
jgi:CrcB protein